jgi:hypothetical protein
MNVCDSNLVKGNENENKEYFCAPARNHHDGANRRNSCNWL